MSPLRLAGHRWRQRWIGPSERCAMPQAFWRVLRDQGVSSLSLWGRGSTPPARQGKMLPSFEDFGNAATFCIYSRILSSLSLLPLFSSSWPLYHRVYYSFLFLICVSHLRRVKLHSCPSVVIRVVHLWSSSSCFSSSSSSSFDCCRLSWSLYLGAFDTSLCNSGNLLV